MASKSAKILIIGGGFGGLFTALDLSGAGEITLVSDEDHFTFRPMLYEYLSGEVEAWHIAPNYSELLDGVKIVRGEVAIGDRDAHQRRLRAGRAGAFGRRQVRIEPRQRA